MKKYIKIFLCTIMLLTSFGNIGFAEGPTGLEIEVDYYVAEDGIFTLKGQVRDVDNDDVKLTAEVGGVTKTQMLSDTANWRDFTFTFDIRNDQIPQYINEVKVIADDGRGGIATAIAYLEVTARLGHDVWLLVDTLVTEYPAKTYEDPEDDTKYQEQYRFTHDPNYYSNPIGLFDRHQEWITLTNTNELPVTRFSKTGKYVLDYRARDNPHHPDVKPNFDEFYKWSDRAVDFVKFYVHRKPIADYVVLLEPSGSNFRVKLKSYGYDLDNVTKPNRGISQVQWRYRAEGDMYWNIASPVNVNEEDEYIMATLPANQNYEVAMRVRDIDGPGGRGVWSDWVEKSFITKNPPLIGFAVLPDENPRNANFTIIPKSGVRNATYTITRNTDNKEVYNQFHASDNIWQISFSELINPRDYYTIRQQVTVDGVTAEHIEQISVYNRIPVINNTQITDRNNNRLNLSSNINSPTVTNTLKPTFYYRYNDADADRQVNYRITIRDMEHNQVEGTGLRTSNLASGSTVTWTPSINLKDRTKYYIVFEAFDGYDWIEERRYFEIQTNRAPIADFNVNPNPTSRLTTTQFTSKAYDPDGDSISHLYEQRKKGTTTWNFFSNQPNPTFVYPELGTWEVRQTVTDPLGLSDSIIKEVFVENLPPVPLFDIFPIVAYEGDTLRAVDRSTDPESDAIIAHEWQVYFPSGATATFTTKDIEVNNTVPGTYQFRKRVMDEHGTWSQWSDWQPKIVHELTVKGKVKHTDQWNKNRIAYNQSKTRTDDYPRGYEVFFPGEKFLLEADTTIIDPLSTVEATSVHVRILGTNFETYLSPTNSGKNNWTGELWDQEMMKWNSRDLTFRFTATWNNGTVKTDDVKITIDDDPYWREHRRK